ncbi:uncharacterized protein METZ01_LOCUS367267, partial [marine metagenome]
CDSLGRLDDPNYSGSYVPSGNTKNDHIRLDIHGFSNSDANITTTPLSIY